MLHLYYFESLLEQHGICYGYKLVLEWWASKLGIIRTIIGSELDAMRSLCLMIVLRYEDGNIRVMLVG